MTIKYIITVLLFLLGNSIYSYPSYHGLLLPNSSYELLSNDSNYEFSTHILTNSDYSSNLATTLFTLPHNISIGAFQYIHTSKKYYNATNLSIINYGSFDDSESGYTFSSEDYILKNTLFYQLDSQFYSSLGCKYIHSNIDNFTADAITFKLAVYYHYQNFLIQLFSDNLGLVINSYTDFDESLPIIHGLKIMYSPKYLKSILSLKYDYFNEQKIFYLSYELLSFKYASFYIGHSSLSSNLYYGDFDNDFFTGLSFGIGTQYKGFSINLAGKNLGPLGLIKSITITKLIN